MRYARLGVEELDGAAIYWHRVRRCTYLPTGQCWLYLCAVEWLLAAGD
jgi:hypothetical protein